MTRALWRLNKYENLVLYNIELQWRYIEQILMCLKDLGLCSVNKSGSCAFQTLIPVVSANVTADQPATTQHPE